MAHAKLSPSRASRRMECPGSMALEEKYPESSESPAAREGTAAHWVAAEYIRLGEISAEYAPNGELITQEMVEGAQLYTETVASYYSLNPEAHLLSPIHIEETIDISNIHPECFGTPDLWFVLNEHLYVFDYKYGHGFVDVYENWQLLEYAAGIIQTNTVSKITLVIVQPRCFVAASVRHWDLTAPQLYRYIERLKESELGSMIPDAVLIPSYSACRYCTGRAVCPALANTSYCISDISRMDINTELDPIQTGRELKQLRTSAQLLNARIISLEIQAESMIAKGERVEGFSLESTAGREQWTKSAEEIITLGDLMGIDLSKPKEPITPVQARKIGITDEVLKIYAQRTRGKLKLVENPDSSRIFVDM